MQPAFPHGLSRQSVLLIVAQHYRRSAQKDLADGAFADRLTVFSDDLETMIRQRRTTADERYGGALACIRNCNPVLGQLVGHDRVGPKTAAARRERRGEHVLGEAITGQEARLTKTCRRKFF